MARPLSCFQVARGVKEGTLLADSAAFHRVFHIHYENDVSCVIGSELSQKYKIPVEPVPGSPGFGRNVQEICGITNKYLGEQVWFNKQRTAKPQTFEADGMIKDPTIEKGCDFCRPEFLTALDAFGRIERPHAVSASNLFKYGVQHGLIVLKSHDPLNFDLAQLSDLLAVSAEWIRRAFKDRPDCTHPLFIWNTLPRSGASQYHPHTQLLLSPVSFPMQERIDLAQLRASSSPSAPSIFSDILEAHTALGLVRTVRVGESTAHLIASFCPFKDMEVQILSDSLDSPAFALGLHVTLRALIDRLGSRTFNVGVLNLDADPTLGLRSTDGTGPYRPVFGRVMSRGKISSAASDFGGLEVMAGGSIGHTDPFVVMAAIEEELGARNLL